MENSRKIEVVSIDTTINGRHIAGNVSVIIDKDPEYGRRFMVDLAPLSLTEDFLSEHVWFKYDSEEGEYDYLMGRVQDLIRWEALLADGLTETVGRDAISGCCQLKTDLTLLPDGREVSVMFTFDYEGRTYLKENGYYKTVRDSEGINDIWIPASVFNEMCYCEHCGCWVSWDDYHGDDTCCFCAEADVIENYTSSHDHNNDPIYFGEYTGEFAGMGFELEIDCDDSRDDNNEVASHLIEACGLEEHEMRYAHDGSLNYGFECISEPHTVKEFWAKVPQWTNMLKYLSDNGYESHDAKTCGLHVHVSRAMFGKTEAEQTSAIAKVMVFFDENWNDCVKISRRKNFSYCEKNDCFKDGHSSYYCWKKSASRQKGHYVALNNANKHTFEYRLGRGTLNAWSFFSWIDFVLTITKNSRRLTINKVNTNDRVSWLAGIKESTAKYMYKRGAFRSEVLELYPNIAWEADLVTDNRND